MGTVSLSGSIVAGPTGSGLGVPSGTATIALALTNDPKGYQVSASGVKIVNSPSSFQALAGVGSGQDVTNADTLYLKTNAPLQVRLTQVGGSAQVISVQGMCLIEFPANALLTLVEVEGAATVEYFASGQS